ncbi:MAG TPA: SRPBCC family protein [Streptosporangiaceae bacterium]|nr:SRPBCC family protein [Streptosporangiaceae bacterium]
MTGVDVLTDVIINRPAPAVCAYAADPANAPAWYVNIESAQWKTPPPLRTGARIAFAARFLGRRLEYTYQVTEFVPGERLVMRTAQGPFPMETTYTWAPADGGATRMTLRNRGEPAGFGKIMAPFVAGAMRRANGKDLARLKSILEAP